MYIIIVGCGRVGSALATKLSSEGHDVVVIDSDAARLKGLDPEFSGQTVVGDASDTTVLVEAKIEQADVLVASTSDDNSNLMSAQVAKNIFDVDRVLVRIKDPRKLEVYRELGVEAVSATLLAVERMAEMLKTAREIHVLGTTLDDTRIVRFTIPSEDGKTAVKKMIQNGALSVCLVSLDGKVSLGHPQGKLEVGMEVVGAVAGDRMKALGRMFKKRAAREVQEGE